MRRFFAWESNLVFSAGAPKHLNLAFALFQESPKHSHLKSLRMCAVLSFLGFGLSKHPTIINSFDQTMCVSSPDCPLPSFSKRQGVLLMIPTVS